MLCAATGDERETVYACLKSRERPNASGFRRVMGARPRSVCGHVAAVFIGRRCDLRAGTLAIQTEIGYNTTMVALQFIVVATLVSVLYVYLRQSN